MPILDASGKINSKELPPVRSFNENGVVAKDSAMDETTRIIANIWCTILKVQSLDQEDNFFDLGG